MSAPFTIETEALHLVLRRRRAAADAATGPDRHEPVVERLAPGPPPRVSGAAALDEQTDYVLLVRGPGGARVVVRHADPVVVGGLAHDGDVVHGVVNFGSQIGRSRFVVEIDGRPHLSFEVSVRPTKLDYRADYTALRDDVAAISVDLVLAALRSTHRTGRADGDAPGGRLGWMHLLSSVVGDLERALAHVAAHPLPEASPADRPTRADAVRRPDAALRRAVRRGAGLRASGDAADEAAARGAPPLPETLPHRRARWSMDTPEHRWLSARTAAAAGLLADVARAEAGRTGARAAAVRETLAGLAARVEAVGRIAPLAAAAGPPPREPSVRLLAAPGYREAYAALATLGRGLRLEGGPVGLALEDLHLLYEYWCFLTLVRVVAAEAGAALPARRLLAVESDGLRYRLRRGRRHAVPIPLPGGGAVRVLYNPRFGGSRLLVPQRPDAVLDVRRADGTRARYVLDAKYRLDASPGYVRRYGVPGPPTEALGTLHRYRDAVVDRAGRRTVVQAVALYPWREPAPGAFADSRHGRALGELGVGAIPLLPGATAHLEAWVRGVIGA